MTIKMIAERWINVDILRRLDVIDFRFPIAQNVEDAFAEELPVFMAPLQNLPIGSLPYKRAQLLLFCASFARVLQPVEYGSDVVTKTRVSKL